MDKIRWNQLFTPRTLKRGYELYQSGAVEDIQNNEYAIKGSIFDDDDYYSIVYLRDGMIEDMDCSCENEDEYCEHIAALLYAYDPKQIYQFHDFQESNTDEKYKSVIRDIITESGSYKQMINKLISYKRSILPTITEDSLASLNLVFETFYLISSIPEEKDDILEELKNDLKIIVSCSHNKKTLLDVFEREYHFHKYEKEDEEYLTEVFLECFNETELYEDKYRIVNHMILGSDALKDNWVGRMQYSRWISIGLKMMQEAHQSHQDILHFLDTYHNYSPVFIRYANACLENRNDNKALEVVELGLKYHQEDEDLLKMKKEISPCLNLNMIDWADQFTDVILKRGYDYFYKKKIKKLYQEPYGIAAIVEGSDDYHVTIDLKDKQVTGMYCDCPYANKGHHCKHMAAVLLACSDYENYDDIKAKLDIEFIKELKERIHTLPRDQLEQLLFNEMRFNESLQQRFNDLIETTTIQDKYLDYLVELIDDNEEHIPTLLKKLKKYLRISLNKLISKRAYQTAHALIACTLSKVTCLDPKKEVYDFLKDVHEYLRQLIKIYPSSEEAFNAVKELYGDCCRPFYESMIDSVLLNDFDSKQFYDLKFNLIHQKILYSSLYDDRELQKLIYERWTKYGLDLLIESGKEESVILDYLSQYADSEAVQVNYVDYYVRKGHYQKALDILDEHTGHAYEVKKQEVIDAMNHHKEVS